MTIAQYYTVTEAAREACDRGTPTTRQNISKMANYGNMDSVATMGGTSTLIPAAAINSYIAARGGTPKESHKKQINNV